MSTPQTAPTAPRVLEAKIAAIVDEAEGVKTFTFELPASDPALHFEPGQYLWVSLPGLKASPMAIASGAGEARVELSVRVWGELTRALFEESVGDTVTVDGPHGTHFPVGLVDAGPVYLVAGGTGITPVRALLRTVGARGQKTVLYGARDPSQLLYREELRTWSANVKLAVDSTPPSAVAPLGLDFRVGSVIDLLADTPLHDLGVCFVCGPKPMMEACVVHLRGRGLADDRIYVSLERFDADGNVVGPVYPVSNSIVAL